MFHKQRRLTLNVALFNLSYTFYIVFVKRIKWCIVQMDLSVDVVYIYSSKTKLVWRLAPKHEQLAVEANLSLRGTCVSYFAVYGTISWI